MSQTRFESWHLDLQDLLGLAVPPIAIAFIDHLPAGIGRIERTMPPATTDGRTGPVAASCVFWIEGTQVVFATVAEDHGNCSVGSLTHGFKSVAEIAHKADVAALCETGWVTTEAMAKIAVVREASKYIVYGPLRDVPVEPSVVLLRLNGKQQMLLHDAWPSLRFEGKPQCHIIPIAKESGEIAMSVGCMLSRVRTGMSNNEVTCAIPESRVSKLVERLRGTRRRQCSGNICRSRFQAFCPSSIKPLTVRHAVPVIFQYRQFDAAGGLLSYGAAKRNIAV